ncbi:MAG: prepilin peptidase [Alphaproteobacteria bacterium]|nr:prepilin peptidase [Alphaproteobacteria bacterium]MCK5556639.1 prepilin peptidase [Alphaproteobacteria bacterium]MCK5659460.1 prepilin peptidase [Alphaproteobacteria bacterium]
MLSVFSYLIIFSLLIALAYRDLKEYILPDALNATLALSFIAFHISTHWQLLAPIDTLLGGLAGGGLLFLIRVFANKFYKPDSVGLGDVKFMTAAGLGLGHQDILLALSLGAFFGLLHGLYMAISGKKMDENNTSFAQVNVPAGLGFALGVAVVMLHQFGFEWVNIK